MHGTFLCDSRAGGAEAAVRAEAAEAGHRRPKAEATRKPKLWMRAWCTPKEQHYTYCINV